MSILPAPVGLGAGPLARRRLALWLVIGLVLGLIAGLGTGSEGWSMADLASLWRDRETGQAGLILGEIRLPRSLGAALVGALLGLGGAIAQGVFRNPLADPFLLGSAAGAGLGVVLVLAASVGAGWALGAAGWIAALLDAGAVLAAFVGACVGVLLTLALARGAAHTLRLLLAGVVVGAMLGATADLMTVLVPDALRGRQAFALGSTSLLGWPEVVWLVAGLVLLLAMARRQARALDALTLGEDTAASLGLPIARLRLNMVALMAAATAVAVSQAGLVAFVGLVAPHLVRRRAPGRHGWLLPASAAMGAALLLWADVLARLVLAPRELPLGIVTAVLGGIYLCALLLRQRVA